MRRLIDGHDVPGVCEGSSLRHEAMQARELRARRESEAAAPLRESEAAAPLTTIAISETVVMHREDLQELLRHAVAQGFRDALSELGLERAGGSSHGDPR